jgi:putative membrane protein
MFCQRLLLSLALVGICVASVQAQERRRDRYQNRRPITTAQFVQMASAAGLAEVALGKLASTQASMDDVRKFAQRMVDDHTKAAKQLASIAETKQLPMAKEMDPKHKELEQRLTQLNGPSFDRDYVMAMLKDHEEAVSLFDRYSQSGNDRDLKSFVSQTLPALKEHLSMIQEIAAKIRKTP